MLNQDTKYFHKNLPKFLETTSKEIHTLPIDTLLELLDQKLQNYNASNLSRLFVNDLQLSGTPVFSDFRIKYFDTIDRCLLRPNQALQRSYRGIQLNSQIDLSENCFIRLAPILVYSEFLSKRNIQIIPEKRNNLVYTN